jgi:hypothetical protein
MVILIVLYQRCVYITIPFLNQGGFVGEAKFKLQFKHGGAIEYGQAMLEAAGRGTFIIEFMFFKSLCFTFYPLFLFSEP